MLEWKAEKGSFRTFQATRDKSWPWRGHFSRAWFSGRRQRVGSEMLLLCDQDWKDSVKERVMFGLTKIKAHRFIFSFSIYKKENIFSLTNLFKLKTRRCWEKYPLTMDCWSQLLISKSQARLWVSPAVFHEHTPLIKREGFYYTGHSGSC